MDEGVLRANVIEAKINDVAVKYERANPGADDTEYDYYTEGKIVPAERIIQASGFKVTCPAVASIVHPLARVHPLACGYAFGHRRH